MVECDLPKVETRVRFPSPAPRLVEYWSRLPESNWGPSLYESAALPTELRRHHGLVSRNKSIKIYQKNGVYSIKSPA